jgi:dihydroflavonol-4-reductase
MKYFVTGATGFIGGRVARQLLAAGHEVSTLARTPSKAHELVALGVKVHAGDITDKESLRPSCAGGALPAFTTLRRFWAERAKR